MEVIGADPYVLFDGPSGYYYVYTTSNKTIDGKTFFIYKSKDLVHFEFVSCALDLSKNEWAKDRFWAPECYHNEKTGIYFLFYSSRVKDELLKEYFGTSEYEEGAKIGVAMAKSPEGPFVDISSRPLDYRPFDPDYLNIYPLLKKEDVSSIDYEEAKEVSPRGVYIPSIDVDLLFDDDGKIYLYYSRCCYPNYVYDRKLEKFIEESNILAIEIDDSRWNDASGRTMPKVADRYKNKHGEAKDGYVEIITYHKQPQEWENGHVNDHRLSKGKKKDRRWAEGSTTIFRYFNGVKRYFIFYSCNNYENANYGVGLAFSSSPLGPFEKYSDNPLIHSIEEKNLFSTGHGSLIYSNGEDHYVFHGRSGIDKERSLYSCKVRLNFSSASIINLSKGVLS